MTSIIVLGDRNTEHVTHRALDAVIAQLPEGVEARWVGTEVGDPGPSDGVWVAPGGPYRDGGAVLSAVRRARADGTPLLGTCSGFQYTALALAGLDERRHAESRPDAPEPFVAPLACRLDGETRTVTAGPQTRLAAVLGEAPLDVPFFCGYAPTDEAAAMLEAAGVVISARLADVGAVALELPGHPFLMATLFHPQLGALRGEPLSPLIAAFVDAARSNS
jgi:CTP synthase (UTP-ammonia lyase)